MNETACRTTTRRDVAVVTLITLIAFFLRWVYVHTAQVDNPLRGDAARYVAYALNLLHDHTFSMALPGREVVRADSFRDPGYPVFLAALTVLGTDGSIHYLTVLDAQAVLSALTVGMLTWLTRQSFGLLPAIFAGCLMAFWPHSITAADYLLSESFFGATLALALVVLDYALRRSQPAWFLGAGLAWAIAALTNAVVLPFAPLLALVMVFRDSRRRSMWLLLLAGVVVPVGAWQLRAALLPHTETSSDRALMNLVQGAWPEYRYVYGDQANGNPELTAIARAIDSEYELVRDQPIEGLRAMATRLGQQPWRSLSWYVSKPAQLWGWNIGVGDGDVYVITTSNSPLHTLRSWRTVTDGLYLFNPFIMLLAAAGCILLLLRRRPLDVAQVAALLALFVTVIYTVLQADARYATPYRGIEMVFAVYAIQEGVRWARLKRALIAPDK